MKRKNNTAHVMCPKMKKNIKLLTSYCERIINSSLGQINPALNERLSWHPSNSGGVDLVKGPENDSTRYGFVDPQGNLYPVVRNKVSKHHVGNIHDHQPNEIVDRFKTVRHPIFASI